MRRFQLRALSVLALGAGSAIAEVNYHTDFQGGVAGAEWSKRVVETAPRGNQKFLGQFGAETVSLMLPTVRRGEDVNLQFDFLAIRTWDGNPGGGGPGPDIFGVLVNGGPTLLYSTFSVGDPKSNHRMSYPDVAGFGAFESRHDAAANDTLGYTYGPNAFPLDATWSFNFSFTAPADGLVISFAGVGLQNIEDESWGLDNVQVSTPTIPAPGALALAGPAALLLRRRRRE